MRTRRSHDLDDVTLELRPHQPQGSMHAPILGVEARVLSRAFLEPGKKVACLVRIEPFHLPVSQYRIRVGSEDATRQGRTETRNPGVKPPQRRRYRRTSRYGGTPQHAAAAEQPKDSAVGQALVDAARQPGCPEVLGDRTVQAREASLAVCPEQPGSQRVGGSTGQRKSADIGNVQEARRCFLVRTFVHAQEVAHQQRRVDRARRQQNLVFVPADEPNDLLAAVATEHRAAGAGEQLGTVFRKLASCLHDLSHQAQAQGIAAGSAQLRALQFLQQRMHLQPRKLVLQERTRLVSDQGCQVERRYLAGGGVLDPCAVHGFAPLGPAAGQDEGRAARLPQLPHHRIGGAGPAGRRGLVETVDQDTPGIRKQGFRIVGAHQFGRMDIGHVLPLTHMVHERRLPHAWVAENHQRVVPVIDPVPIYDPDLAVLVFRQQVSFDPHRHHPLRCLPVLRIRSTARSASRLSGRCPRGDARPCFFPDGTRGSRRLPRRADPSCCFHGVRVPAPSRTRLRGACPAQAATAGDPGQRPPLRPAHRANAPVRCARIPASVRLRASAPAPALRRYGRGYLHLSPAPPAPPAQWLQARRSARPWWSPAAPAAWPRRPSRAPRDSGRG